MAAVSSPSSSASPVWSPPASIFSSPSKFKRGHWKRQNQTLQDRVDYLQSRVSQLESTLQSMIQAVSQAQIDARQTFLDLQAAFLAVAQVNLQYVQTYGPLPSQVPPSAEF